MCLLDTRDEGLEGGCHLETPQSAQVLTSYQTGFFIVFSNRNAVQLKTTQLCTPFHFEKTKRTLNLIHIFSSLYLPLCNNKKGGGDVHHDGDMRLSWFVITLRQTSCFRKMNGGPSSEGFPVDDLSVFLFIDEFCVFF